MIETLDDLIAGLLSGKTSRVARAREILLDKAGNPSMREEVCAKAEGLLSHQDPNVRGTAFLMLAEAKGEEALSIFVDAQVKETDVGARHDLVSAVSGLGKAARQLLERFSRDDVFEIRFLAAAELAGFGDESVVKVLLEGLGWNRTRFQALSSLYRLGDRAAMEPARKLFHQFFVGAFERTAAAGLLAKLGDDEARAWLVERIARRRGDDRGLAIELAGDMRLLAATDALAKVLKDPKDQFRGAAARALGMLGDERLRDLLVKVLADEAEDADTRMDSAEGLLHMGTLTARRALEEALLSVKNPEVLAVVKEALETLVAEGSAT